MYSLDDLKRVGAFYAANEMRCRNELAQGCCDMLNKTRTIVEEIMSTAPNVTLVLDDINTKVQQACDEWVATTLIPDDIKPLCKAKYIIAEGSLNADISPELIDIYQRGTPYPAFNPSDDDIQAFLNSQPATEVTSS